jgi:hypothetical protein
MQTRVHKNFLKLQTIYFYEYNKDLVQHDHPQQNMKLKAIFFNDKYSPHFDLWANYHYMKKVLLYSKIYFLWKYFFAFHTNILNMIFFWCNL